MSQALRSAGPEEQLPPETREEILFRVMVEAYLATTSRKRGAAGLKCAAKILAREVAMADVMPIRGDINHAARSRNLRQAMERVTGWLPAFLARLPEE